MIDLSGYRELFLTEAEEHLERLNRELLRLEADPAAPGAVGEIFRSLHTLKGMAGAMGYERLAGLAHALEELFEGARRDPAHVDPDLVDLALAGVDALEAGVADDAGEAFTAGAGRVLTRIAGRATRQPEREAPPPVRAREEAIPARGRPAAASVKGAPARERTVRVRDDLLERLLNRSGELVIASQQLEELGRTSNRPEMAEVIRRAVGNALELQREVLASRMQPVGSVFERFARGVRDLARRGGKSVELAVAGQEIELDRAVLDEIAEPLLHLVRNAVDHGIEGPAERLAAGKPATGTLRLSAWRDGSSAVLEVADDGRGLDRAALRRAAVARGLVTEEEVGRLGDHEVDRLATSTGLSTARTVSQTSGRGVGLDAVQVAVSRLGGELTIRSASGRGTSFRLRLPVTLAVQRCLVVESGGQRYAIPIAYVQELTRLETATEVWDGEPRWETNGLELRGERLACRPLAAVLGAQVPAARVPSALAVVLAVGGGRLAVAVERAIGSRDLVIRRFQPLRGGRLPFNGVAVLGDGSLALLVDAGRLAGMELCHGEGGAMPAPTGAAAGAPAGSRV